MAFVFLFVFFSVLLWNDLPFFVSSLAGGLFGQPLLSIRGVVSSPSSEYLCFLEMSVQDSECFFSEYLPVYSLLESDRLEEDVEEEEEKE